MSYAIYLHFYRLLESFCSILLPPHPIPFLCTFLGILWKIYLFFSSPNFPLGHQIHKPSQTYVVLSLPLHRQLKTSDSFHSI